ncbi:hypothetical protein Q8A67_013716 [Cirrhinus molitorella]|uniref:Uncharacterized protein n=1 Tax=Cirrhinus molitorella TaxID=172907 RepID=A0AA88TVG9_9TELE|nr:hypothetical protein Q8A67_013716 [Cirrhinus molitorella]
MRQPLLSPSLRLFLSPKSSLRGPLSSPTFLIASFFRVCLLGLREVENSPEEDFFRHPLIYQTLRWTPGAAEICARRIQIQGEEQLLTEITIIIFSSFMDDKVIWCSSHIRVWDT